jgi:copper chaperone CopZ
MVLSCLCLVLSWTASAQAETKVVLKGVHLCCPGCVSTVGKTVKEVEGVKVACDRQARTVTIAAPDDETAQKALDALAKAGFHGKSDNKAVKMKDDSGASEGKVQKVTVTGAHNCCGMCCRTIKATVKKVEGVKGDTAKPKGESFDVTGDFDAAALVKALNAAGFHVKIEK